MVLGGPQRGLFLGCLAAGVASLLALNLHFAPAAITEDVALTDAGALPSRTAAVGTPSSSAVRVVIPAQARVPTIVARFDTESKEPTDQSAIRALATAMIEDHDARVVLEGHSDTQGGKDYNHEISLARAEWVKARLVALGVSPARIETVGLGATRPLRGDATQAVNRRVEVRWVGTMEGRDVAPSTPAAKPTPALATTPVRPPASSRPATSAAPSASTSSSSAPSPSSAPSSSPSSSSSTVEPSGSFSGGRPTPPPALPENP